MSALSQAQQRVVVRIIGWLAFVVGLLFAAGIYALPAGRLSSGMRRVMVDMGLRREADQKIVVEDVGFLPGTVKKKYKTFRVVDGVHHDVLVEQRMSPAGDTITELYVWDKVAERFVTIETSAERDQLVELCLQPQNFVHELELESNEDGKAIWVLKKK